MFKHIGTLLRNHYIEKCKSNSTFPIGTFYKVKKPLIVYKKARSKVKDLYTWRELTYKERGCASRWDANTIVKLEIPVGAVFYAQSGHDNINCGSSSKKCRCSRAKVLSISISKDLGIVHNGSFINVEGRHIYAKTPLLEMNIKESYSNWDNNFTYKIDEIVKPIKRFSYIQDKCESGVHFFFDIEKAKNY